MMRFKTYLSTLNELSLVAKEDTYKGSLMSLAKDKYKSKDVKKVFDTFKIPEDAVVQFLGFNEKNRVKPNNTIVFKKNADNCLIQYQAEVYNIVMSKKTFQSWWKGSGGKSDTNDLTELKEFISLVIFTKEISEYELQKIVQKEKNRLYPMYKSEFYTSALKQAEALKKFGMKRGTYYELQGETYSNEIYTKAQTLGLKGEVNNWNPGDVWGFSKTGIKSLSELDDITDLSELSIWLKNKHNSKDIVSISLKHVLPKNKASVEIVDPDNLPSTTKSFKLTRIKMTETGSYKSIFFETECNISLKGNMRGTGTSTCLNMEMYDHNKGNSLGAVPAPLWKKLIAKENTKACYNFKEVAEADLIISKGIYKKYKSKIVGPDFDYSNLGETTQIRYCIVASVLDFVMKQPDITKFIKEMYFLSQKIVPGNPVYIKIS